MNPVAEPVVAWLGGKIRRQIWLNCLGGAGLMLAALLALLFTFGLVFCTLLVAFHWAIPFQAGTVRVWVAVAVIGFLFLAHALTDRDSLAELSVTTFDGEKPVSIYLPPAGLVSNVVFFAPDSLRSLARMLLDLGFLGPRLAVAAVHAWRNARRLARLDVAACGAVLALLLSAPGRVPFRTIFDHLGWEAAAPALPQVARIEGVVVLPTDPAGLSLTAEMREEFRQHRGRA